MLLARTKWAMEAPHVYWASIRMDHWTLSRKSRFAQMAKSHLCTLHLRKANVLAMWAPHIRLEDVHLQLHMAMVRSQEAREHRVLQSPLA